MSTIKPNYTRLLDFKHGRVDMTHGSGGRAMAQLIDELFVAAFDNEKVDKEFFAGTKIKSNFVINLGYGDSSKLFPRSPRLPFEEAVQIL